jgi:hypothetical protein
MVWAAARDEKLKMKRQRGVDAAMAFDSPCLVMSAAVTLARVVLNFPLSA